MDASLTWPPNLHSSRDVGPVFVEDAYLGVFLADIAVRDEPAYKSHEGRDSR